MQNKKEHVQRTCKEQLKSAHLNTLGNKTFYVGFWEVRRGYTFKERDNTRGWINITRGDADWIHVDNLNIQHSSD